MESSIWAIYNVIQRTPIPKVKREVITQLPSLVHELLDSRYVHPNVLNTGMINPNHTRFSFETCRIHVQCSFLNVDALKWSHARMHEMVQWCYRSVFFIHNIIGPQVRQPSHVHIVLVNSPQLKTLPKDGKFTSEHVNSALCMFHHGILVYRQEEMVKVLLHELVHYFMNYLPEAPSKDVARIANWFNIEERTSMGLALSECYTDMVACWLISHFLVLYGSDKWKETTSQQSFENQVKRVLVLQHTFMLRQVHRIRDVYVSEATHVFCYYIAKAAVFGNVHHCIEQWHPSQIAKDANLIKDFYRFVVECVASPTFVKEVKKATRNMSSSTSLRMQRIEL